MSDEPTPRTDASEQEMWGRVGVMGCADAALARKLERENARLKEFGQALRDALDEARSIGTVRVYPGDWRCAKMGGHPPIDAYEERDLSGVGDQAIADWDAAQSTTEPQHPASPG